MKHIFWLFAVVSALAAGPGSASSGEVVGEVTLAVGQALLVSPDGSSMKAARGAAVRVGDRIDTAGGGQAMVRFVDGGFISVRAGSRLLVEAYRYDAARPQDSAIKLSLTEGVARSITGRGGEAARERFRLNTPVAAIGVKGTDFVVQAQPDVARVAVYQGAVVVSPFGTNCAAEGAGPCANGVSRILGDAAGAVMLEVNRREASPQVVPLSGALQEPQPAGEPRTRRPGEESASRRNDTVPLTAAANLSTQEAPIASVTPLPAATLIWGRWSWVDAAPEDKLTTPGLAQIAKGLEAATGSSYAALYRPRLESELTSDLGRVDLSLREGLAYLKSGDSLTPGKVTGGRLSLDFTNWTFATQLAITHPTVSGPIALSGSGAVRADGVFTGKETGGGIITGATNAGATEAGYAFEKAITSGTLTGLTLWRR